MSLHCYLYHADCLKVLPLLGTNKIDLILTDPPYNIANETKLTIVDSKVISNKEAWGNDFEDNISEPQYEKLMLNLAKNSFRVLKRDGSFITFFDRGKPYLLKPFYRLLEFRNMISFIKSTPAPHLRKNNYRSGYELSAWFSKPTYHINFISQKEMINVFYGHGGVISKKTKHPTEKYEWMIKPLIERHSRKGDVILDPFMGSGTVMKVAQDLGRSCIGIEIKEEYCDMIKKRCFGRTFLDRSYEYKFVDDL